MHVLWGSTTGAGKDATLTRHGFCIRVSCSALWQLTLKPSEFRAALADSRQIFDRKKNG